MIIDIPLTLVLIFLLGILSVIGNAFTYLYYRHQIKKIMTYLIDVPKLDPESIAEMEDRMRAWHEYGKGNIKPLQEHWKKHYGDKDGRKGVD